MKKILYFAVLNCLIIIPGYLKAQNTFINIYDSANYVIPKDIAFNNLNEIFVCGWSAGPDDDYYTNYVLKLNGDGSLNHVFMEKDTTIMNECFVRIIELENEMYVFGSAGSKLPEQPNPSVLFKKFDNQLNATNSNRFYLDGEIHNGIHHCSRVTYHNNMFIFFSSAFLNTAQVRLSPFFLEISKDGQFLRVANDRESDEMHFHYDFLIKPNNEGFLAFICEYSTTANYEGFFYSYNSNLENLEKIPLQNNFQNYFSCLSSDENSFYLSGTYKNSISSKQVGLMKMEANGTVLKHWLFQPENTDSTSYTAYYNSLDELSCGDIVLCGTYNVKSQFIPQQWPSWISLYRFSPDLELMWHRFIGGDANYEAYAMRISPNDEIVIAGCHSPVPPQSMYDKDLMIIKTDSDGLISGVNDQISSITTTEAILYPNPAQDFIIVDFSLLYKTATLQLIDLAGRAVWEKALTANHQQVDISGVPAGAYVYRIFNSKGLEESGKLVVE